MSVNNLKKLSKAKHAGQKYAVEMLGITKTFANGIIANQDFDLSVKPNTIHALIGENGAGKSTLMSILFGIYHPDNGKIKINGAEVKFNSPHDATQIGLGMVHQHFKLIPVFSILKNIVLGAEVTSRFGFLNMRKAKTKIMALSEKYNLPINLNRKINETSVGEQQRVEILKLLYHDSHILIFDEPTAVLSDSEIKVFLQMLLHFKKQGKTIIIITHKLNEVKEVADYATIIRHGKKVGDFDVKKTSVQVMTDAMVGCHLHIEKNTMLNFQTERRPVILKVEDLHALNVGGHKIEALKGISFNVHAGEILGIAGVEGNGQTELAMLIGGLLRPTSGQISLLTDTNTYTQLNHLSVKEHYRHGIAHVPEDRHKYGLLLDETVAFNCVAPLINEKPFSRFGFINKQAIREYATNICTQFDVRGAKGGKNIARSLSGGNQQKLVFGREISRPHKLIVYVQPTRGLDFGAIQKIHKDIVKDAKHGAAVILISYELDEIFNVATNVIALLKGRITYYGAVKKTNRSMLGNYISLHEGATS
ncbi:MAG: ABC transporter ATP-binding protein [Mycoplasmataceae bacterium]|jgi:simple sugar transport system ATP-binding protein|nr:ABC transporter ATP-binding protein [Mycoplasmataceae bacterium]